MSKEDKMKWCQEDTSSISLLREDAYKFEVRAQGRSNGQLTR